MQQYVDSYNYEMMTDSLTDKLSVENRTSDEFFNELKTKARELRDFAQAEYYRRSEISSLIEDEEWDDPEQLDDFDTAPEHITESNYDSWDRFMDAKDEFESDTNYLLKFIDELGVAAYNIGGLD